MPRLSRPRACFRPALPGKLYCLSHSHHEREIRLIEDMPTMYRLVSRSLGKRLDELEEQREKRMSLVAELDLVRASADEAVHAYGFARDMLEEAEHALSVLRGTDGEKTARDNVEQARRVAITSGAVMRDVLTQVGEFVAGVAKLDAMRDSTLSPEAVRSVMVQCAQLLYEVCGDEHEDLAARFEALLHSRVTMNVQEKVQSQRLTLETDYRRMRASVPDAD